MLETSFPEDYTTLALLPPCIQGAMAYLKQNPKSSKNVDVLLFLFARSGQSFSVQEIGKEMGFLTEKDPYGKAVTAICKALCEHFSEPEEDGFCVTKEKRGRTFYYKLEVHNPEKTNPTKGRYLKLTDKHRGKVAKNLAKVFGRPVELLDSPPEDLQQYRERAAWICRSDLRTRAMMMLLDHADVGTRTTHITQTLSASAPAVSQMVGVTQDEAASLGMCLAYPIRGYVAPFFFTEGSHHVLLRANGEKPEKTVFLEELFTFDRELALERLNGSDLVGFDYQFVDQIIENQAKGDNFGVGTLLEMMNRDRSSRAMQHCNDFIDNSQDLATRRARGFYLMKDTTGAVKIFLLSNHEKKKGVTQRLKEASQGIELGLASGLILQILAATEGHTCDTNTIGDALGFGDPYEIISVIEALSGILRREYDLAIELEEAGEHYFRITVTDSRAIKRKKTHSAYGVAPRSCEFNEISRWNHLGLKCLRRIPAAAEHILRNASWLNFRPEWWRVIWFLLEEEQKGNGAIRTDHVMSECGVSQSDVTRIKTNLNNYCVKAGFCVQSVHSSEHKRSYIKLVFFEQDDRYRSLNEKLPEDEVTVLFDLAEPLTEAVGLNYVKSFPCEASDRKLLGSVLQNQLSGMPLDMCDVIGSRPKKSDISDSYHKKNIREEMYALAAKTRKHRERYGCYLRITRGNPQCFELVRLAVPDFYLEKTGVIRGEEHLDLLMHASGHGIYAGRAMNRLIEGNMGMIKIYAEPFKELMDEDDLLQEAILGFREAVKRFDPNLGYTLSTYSKWWVRQRIIRAIEATAPKRALKLPHHVSQSLTKFRKLEARVSQMGGNEDARNERLAILLDCTPADIIELRKLDALGKKADMVRKDDGKPMNDHDREAPKPDEAADRNIQAAVVREVLQRFSSVDQAIIYSRIIAEDDTKIPGMSDDEVSRRVVELRTALFRTPQLAALAH